MKKKIAVVEQKQEQPIEVKIIAESIVAISEGVKRLRKGMLNDRAIVLLIHDACSSDRSGKKPVKQEIRNILDTMESLTEIYLRKKSV